MNFTSDVKKEIISRKIAGNAEKKAALSAFVRTSGQLFAEEGKPGFRIVTETENVAEFFTSLFSELFGGELSVARASVDRMSGRGKLSLECPPRLREKVLKELGFLRRSGGFAAGISARIVPDAACALAYVKGAFLGGGSCILPGGEGGKTGYHLEFVFPEKRAAADFCRLLEENDLLAKRVQRKDTAVVYIKSKETISDFLAAIGAENALRKFSGLVEKRDEANYSNRAANCFSGNADKSAAASVRQVMAISSLAERGGLEGLDAGLRATAEARTENPSLSLKELAAALKISKSCLSHRLRRLEELAAKAAEEGEGRDKAPAAPQIKKIKEDTEGIK